MELKPEIGEVCAERLAPVNRTKVELKRIYGGFSLCNLHTVNRTKVELKLGHATNEAEALELSIVPKWN